jgi:DNA polymerase III delta prime subunit
MVWYELWDVREWWIHNITKNNELQYITYSLKTKSMKNENYNSVQRTLHMYCSTCLILNNTNTKKLQQFMYVFSTLQMNCSTFVMYSVNNNRVLNTLFMYWSTLQRYYRTLVMY